MFQPFTKLPRLILRVKEPVGVFILNENIPTEQFLPVLKRSLRGVWYYVVPRIVRVRDTIIRNKLTDFRWVKKLKLIPILETSFKRQKNVVYDWTTIFNVATEKFPPRHRIFETLVLNHNIFKDRLNILFYTIDLHEPAPRLLGSKIFQILYFAKRELKNEEVISQFPKNIVLTILSGNKVFYVPIIVNGDYTHVGRALSFIKRFLGMAKKFNQKVDVEKETKTIQVDIQDIEVNQQAISKAIISTEPEKIQNHKEKYGKVNTPALLFNVADKIIPDSVANEFEPLPRNKVRNSLSNIVDSDFVKGNTQSPVSKILKQNTLPNPPNDTIIKYSEIESKNVVNTLLDLLEVYSRTDIGLKVINHKIEKLPFKENEVAPSDLMLLTITVQDKFGKIHELKLKLPAIKEDGSYFVYGNKYIAVKQIFPIPITFPKPGEGKYKSYTVSFSLLKQRYFTVVYISGEKIPLGILLSYFFGFDSIMDKYKIKWEIQETDNKDKSVKTYKLPNGKYIWFHNYDSMSDMQKDLIESMFKFKGIENIRSEFPTKDYFKEFLSLYTGNEDFHERIDYLLRIAIDKRTYQILREKSLPLTLIDIFTFMHKNVLAGYKTDRNSLQESRIRGHEAISHIAFDVLRKSLSSYIHQVKRENPKAKLVINPDSVLSAIITSSSFQLMEYINPIEEVMQHYKVTYSGYAGIPSDAVSDAIRASHMTSFGTIDPIDVPSGASIGVVQHFTMNQVLTYNGSVVVKDISDNIGNNILSFSTASIPFVSKNEPVRVMMGSNQSRQALTLKHPEPAIVQSGVESILGTLLKSDVFLSKAPCDGIIQKITNEYIHIKSKEGTCKVDIRHRIARSGQSYSSVIKKKPIVKVGQKVRKGDILTDSNAFKNGIASYGRNLVTTYMFWEGFTYEDGVVIAENVTDKFTSVHAIKVSTFIDEQDRVVWINPNLKVGNKVKSGEELVKIAGMRYIDLLDAGVIDDDNLIIFGNRYKLVAPYDGTILSVNFYLSGINEGNLSPDVRNVLRGLGVQTESEYLYKGKKYKGIFVKIELEVEKKLELGDKLTNRHASKGIVCKIEPIKNMPKLPDGRHVEIIINPMSYINRTNVGQLYELYVGEIGYQLYKRMFKLPRKQFIKLLGQVMINLDKDFYGGSVYNFLSRCSDREYKNFMKFVESCRGFPIVVPPFKEPSHKQIYKVMKILGIPAKYNCTLPDGSKKQIPVGMQYILKLEHMSSHKVYSRSIGSYQRKTGQPTQGKARGGGQRVGEQDFWTLVSWNADNIVRELFSAGSDDYRLKQQMYRQIIEHGSVSIEALKEGTQQSKELVSVLFKGVLLEI